MSASLKTGRGKHGVRRYPYGIGDGTTVGDMTTDERSDREDDASSSEDEQEDGRDGDGGDDRSDDRTGDNPYVNIQAQEQIINVTPDTAIRLVVQAAEPKPPAKKEHPQDKITKFWLNFEPEYLGGVTQILPDSVADKPASARKESSDLSPKAVHSYENARTACIKSVRRIIRECKSDNKKYTDPHFDLERDLKVTRNRDCLYGLTTRKGDKDPGDVKRITDVFDHPQFFKDGAGFDDIVQGALGDCWYLAALSAVTANQELLRKVCVIQDQDVGVYGFVFHRDGDWHPCIIDDKLYLAAPSFDESGDVVLEQYGVRQNEQEKLYQETLQKGSKALYFAKCRDENETWVPLFEKAYAKAHGDFTSLDGGQVGEAIEDLTGGVTTEIYTTNILSKESFWRDLQRIGKDFIFSCHVSLFSDWRGVDDDYEVAQRDRRLKGIVQQHAYSILDTYEGYGQRLVKIRNPWGRAEWNGAWSDGAKEWTAEWLHRLEHKFGDDGVFWMSYEDMLKKYKYMDRTRLFGPEWFIAQEWTSVQVPWNCRDYLSTSFSIEVPEETDAVITLSQLDDRYFKGFEGPYWYVLSFRVQKDDEDGDEDDYFARSPVNYELRRSTNVEVHLEKGKYTVLFKIEAKKCSRKEIETVIRDNIWRRDKITQMATLYDLAYRKGKTPKKEELKKEEPKKEEPVAEQPQKEESPSTKDATPEKEKSKEADKEEKIEEKMEDKKEAESEKPTEDKKDQETEQKTEQEKEKGEQQGNTDKERKESKKEEKEKETEKEEEQPITVMTQQAPGSSDKAEEKEKPQPDEKDPNRNPWNASCVVGMRVFSKLPELKLKVTLPGDNPDDGVTLDRDDIAKSAQVEAEKA